MTGSRLALGVLAASAAALAVVPGPGALALAGTGAAAAPYRLLERVLSYCRTGQGAPGS
jgi:hypothetical protein